MSYSVSIKQSAAKAIANIVKKDRDRIIEAIDQLRNNPFAGSLLKGDLTGLRRIRNGNYRIVYELQQSRLMILVIRIGHRRDVHQRD
jgi:mRNA interferase RelE/StbE